MGWSMPCRLVIGGKRQAVRKATFSRWSARSLEAYPMAFVLRSADLLGAKAEHPDRRHPSHRRARAAPSCIRPALPTGGSDWRRPASRRHRGARCDTCKPRASTCGSAKTSSIALIGPQGTAAGSKGRHPFGGGARLHRLDRGARSSASRFSTRARLVAKRGSPGRAAARRSMRQYSAELPVIADRDDDVAVLGREGLVGHDIGMGIAEAARRLCRRRGN